MNTKSILVAAAVALVFAGVPAQASVETRSTDAIPSVKHVRYAQDNDRDRDDAGRAARRAAHGGGGGLGVSTGVLAALAGVLGAIGIAVALSNRSN